MFVNFEKIELDWFCNNGDGIGIDFTFFFPVSDVQGPCYEVIGFGTDQVVLLVDHCDVAHGLVAVKHEIHKRLLQKIKGDNIPKDLDELSFMFECQNNCASAFLLAD